MKKHIWTLGINASHNGSACLLRGNEIAVAIQEERLTGSKRHRIWGGKPSLAVAYCLEYVGIKASDIDLIALCVQGESSAVEQQLALNPQLEVERNGTRTLIVPHHLAHGVSSFATSGMESAAILVIDGVGSPWEDLTAEERKCQVFPAPEGWEIVSSYEATGGRIRALEKHMVVQGKKWLALSKQGMPKFGSLGGMYSAVAQQIFGDPMEAGQVMGLAPFGKPVYPIDEFFEIESGNLIFSDRISERFTTNERWPKCRTEYENLACSVQEALTFGVLHLARQLHLTTGNRSLCYSGGVALNGVVNEQILHHSGFQDLFIPPAAEDSGTAIGAAYWGFWQLAGKMRSYHFMADAMGRTYSAADCWEALIRVAPIKTVPTEALLDEVVERLAAGQFGGWFRGRSELGPRALGQRSILADPRSASAKDTLNARIKRRASFRPFAPAVLLDQAAKWFQIPGIENGSAYMLRVCPFVERMSAAVPAVAHVDGSARVQTVTPAANSAFHDLLCRFHEKTGVPILLNTSFNARSEPIVETPEDALWSFLGTGLDFCVLENTLVVRQEWFNSVLDLYPKLTCELKQIADGSPERGGGLMVLVQARTRWGDCLHEVPKSFMSLVRYVDGTRNGRDIYQQMLQVVGFDPNELVFEEMLLRLRRLSIVEFQVRPDATATSPR